MKKILYTLLAFSITFTSCKKEEIEGCTDSIATNYDSDAELDDGSCNYSIVGIWEPNSVTIYVLEEEFTEDGVFLYSYDTTATVLPQQVGISGNIEFTNTGNVIITSSDGYVETDNYTTSGNTLIILDDGSGDENTILTYTATQTDLALTFSDTEIDGSTTTTMQQTINCSRQ